MFKTLTALWQACGVSPPKCIPRAEVGQILVYVLPLDRGSMKALWPFLSDDEKARAISYGRELDGLRFAVSRALLRSVLGLYTGIHPGRLILRYGPHGRPYLSQWQAKGIDFNLARRDDCCVIGLALNRHIGIDLEPRRSAALVESMLTMLPAEDRAVIDSAQGLDRSRCLITAWTKLEARAKAIGIGLDEMAMYNDALECQHFKLGSELLGCVASEDHNWQMKLIQWQA
ncbi:MAG: 4'-phosphopantetheinyl transferase superfamily protein [Methanotrichaceae archaeon]